MRTSNFKSSPFRSEFHALETLIDVDHPLKLKSRDRAQVMWIWHVWTSSQRELKKYEA